MITYNIALKENLETSLARDSIISTNNSNGDDSDEEVKNHDYPVTVNHEEIYPYAMR